MSMQRNRWEIAEQLNQRNSPRIGSVFAEEVDKAQSFSRVYFIGAGFSACLGYPLGGALIKSLRDYITNPKHLQEDGVKFENTLALRGLERKELLALFAAINELQDGYLGTQSNVAEFYTLADVIAHSPSVFGLQSDSALANLYDGLAAVTRTYFHDLFRRSGKAFPAQKAILNGINPLNHAVVSFNWDEEVDYLLSQSSRDMRRIDANTKVKHADLDVAYTLGSLVTGSHFLLLKPHGSVGWYNVIQGITNHDHYFVCGRDRRVAPRNRRIVAYEDIALPMGMDPDDDSHDLDIPPLISPPTFAKRFEYEEQWLIWQDVVTVCGQAREFVFLGYSLPSDDYLTRAAVRKALTSQHRGDVRCLVLTNDASSASLLDNYQSVFGCGLTAKRNFLQCDFATSGAKLQNEIVSHLPEATVT